MSSLAGSSDVNLFDVLLSPDAGVVDFIWWGENRRYYGVLDGISYTTEVPPLYKYHTRYTQQFQGIIYQYTHFFNSHILTLNRKRPGNLQFGNKMMRISANTSEIELWSFDFHDDPLQKNVAPINSNSH